MKQNFCQRIQKIMQVLKQDIKQTGMVCILSLFFWGFFYPQFGLAEDTYVCVSEEKEQEPETDFYAILDAGPGEVQIKSRLWEKICETVKKR